MDKLCKTNLLPVAQDVSNILLLRKQFPSLLLAVLLAVLKTRFYYPALVP